MGKARQNLRKRAQWFEDLAVATKDPERAAEYTWQATYLDRRRRVDPFAAQPSSVSEEKKT